jgi:cytochrome c oxidase assembly factor CtaG
MWARVKGQTENALRAMPFRSAYMFRPAYIQPVRGVRSRTLLYRGFYAVLGGLYPLLRRLFPGLVTSTSVLGRALIRAVRDGFPKPVLETRDINRLGIG